jgi:hypothetical protein
MSEDTPKSAAAGPGADAGLARAGGAAVDAAALTRMMAAERQRSRRALFWAGSLFLFVALLVLTMFIAVGIFSLRSARQTYEIAFQADGRTTSFASDIIAVGARVDKLEGAQLDVQDAVDKGGQNLAREAEALRAEIARLRELFEDRRQTEGNAMARMGTDLQELRGVLAEREKDAAGVRQAVTSLAQRVDSAMAATPAAGAAAAAVAGGTGAVARAGAPTGGVAVAAAPGEGEWEGEEQAGVEPREITVVPFPNGDRYEGETRDGLFNGRGVYSFANGDRYEGEFRDDMKEGKGMLKFANGDRYTGEFRNDMMQGRGSMVYANRSKYVGEFRKGVRHGAGVLSFANGDRYEGEFRDDARTGQGTYVFADGSKYIGEFVAGKRSGKGRYVYAGGGEFVGEFKDGRKNGYGECVYASGERVKGYWTDDKFERAAEE